MLTEIKKLDFSLASENDISDIVEITNFYNNSFNSACGFLAGQRTHSKVLENLCDYYVAKSEGEILGLVQISHKLPGEFETLDWYNTGYHDRLKKLETNGDVVYIVLIAVRIGFCNAGVGKFLYNCLFEVLKSSTFFSSVIVKPYNNKYSLNFHRSCGFTEVAYNWNDLIGDIRFESIYLARFPEGIPISS